MDDARDRHRASALTAFGEDEDGELYVAGYGNGTLYRIAPRDTDGDGLPDWWETAYFASATAALAGGDADNDGATNLAEFQNGTDPLWSASTPTSPATLPVLAVYRPSTNRFLIDVDGDRVPDQQIAFGLANDVPLVGRIDTDRRYDLVVWRNGNWLVDVDRDGAVDTTFILGAAGDKPLLADFNGDGRDDLVVWRESIGTWYIDTHRDGVPDTTIAFGVSGDTPLAGDVDGDGIADLVLFRNGIWYVDTNRDGTADITVAFGLPGDTALLFDYDGDGRADFVVVRNGVWYVSTLRDGNAQAIFGYGAATDIPLGWRDR